MRAFTLKDSRDLAVLLIVLTLMTLLLRFTVMTLVQFDLPVADAWLISMLVLLTGHLTVRHLRLKARVAAEEARSRAVLG